MKEEKELLAEIAEARRSERNTDLFIERYRPFILGEVRKNGVFGSEREDEVSVAMFAFYEALMNYDRKKGAFFPLAGLYIRNRLIDYSRKTRRDMQEISLDEEVHEDGKTSLIDTIEDEKSSIEYHQMRESTKEEIEEFRQNLKEYGLELADIAEHCPRQQRTMDTCIAALDYARKHHEILDYLTEKKKLPISELVRHGGFDRKTLERHRKYLVGIFLAFTNGFVIIRGHLTMMKEVNHD